MTARDRSGLRGFSFFRSYFEMAEDLSGDDAARLRFYDAVCRYVFKGEAPDFSDHAMLRMAWRGIEPNLDLSINRARPGNTNASKTQPKRKPNAIETPKPPEDKDKDKDKEMDMDMDMEGESSVAPPDGVAAPPREKNSPSDEKTNFKRWDAETFRSSLRAEVEKDPAFAGIEAAFRDYWLEPDPKGKFRFALEKTWSTAGRLRSWLRREEERSSRSLAGVSGRTTPLSCPPPTGPRWSDHETGENFDPDKLFM